MWPQVSAPAALSQGHLGGSAGSQVLSASPGRGARDLRGAQESMDWEVSVLVEISHSPHSAQPSGFLSRGW